MGGKENLVYIRSRGLIERKRRLSSIGKGEYLHRENEREYLLREGKRIFT